MKLDKSLRGEGGLWGERETDLDLGGKGHSCTLRVPGGSVEKQEDKSLGQTV